MNTALMRLFIAREALDPHLKIGGPVLNTTLPTEVRLKAALNAAWRYALWYPRLWIPYLTAGNADVPKEHRAEVRRISNASRKTGPCRFHAMLRHGSKLDKRQGAAREVCGCGCGVAGAVFRKDSEKT